MATIDDATMRALRAIIQQELSSATSVQAAAQAIAKGVTQYIGARYVPLFAEPLQWDSTKEYEPLTIVLYQGNSYTTRQYTPAGIEITNEAFWAETGNYNAQIEQYRQEVQAFDRRITANSDAIAAEKNERLENVSILTNSCGASNIALYGAKENDTNSIITAIAKISELGLDTIFIPAGRWIIDKPIDLTTYGIHRVCGLPEQTILIGNSSVDYIIKLNQTNSLGKKHYVFGITFTSESNIEEDFVSLCISCSGQVQVEYCNFYNVKCGIKAYQQYYGIVVNNCLFENSLLNGELQTTVAIYAGNDSVISNTKIWGFTYGIKSWMQSLGNSRFTNVYFWNYRREQDTYGIYSTPTSVGTIQCLGCYFDGMVNSVSNIGAFFTNCIFYWGDNDQKSPSNTVQILNSDSNTVLRPSEFVACIVGLNLPFSKIAQLCSENYDGTIRHYDVMDMTPGAAYGNALTIPTLNRGSNFSNNSEDYALYKICSFKNRDNSGFQFELISNNDTRGSFAKIGINNINGTVYNGGWKINEGSGAPPNFYYKENGEYIEIYCDSAWDCQFNGFTNSKISHGAIFMMHYADISVSTNNYAGYTKINVQNVAFQ